MKFSPDGFHLLGGQGSSGIYLDGQLIVPHAGGWDWIACAEMPSGLVVAGPGGFDVTPHGVFQAYNLQSGLSVLANPWTASAFFGRSGAWLSYLADGKTWSWDYLGRQYFGKVALGLSRNLDYIFTDVTGVPLFIQAAGGGWTQVDHPVEWTSLPSGGFFSKNYQGCSYRGQWWACGYLPQPGGLCVWRPFVPGSPIWLLSADGHDFNPDIAARGDGMLVVGSAVNQGELAQRLYEIDVTHLRFTRNGGPWEPLHS